MWNLRWQVDGYLRANPDATEKVLLGRLSDGSNIRGANLKRSCVQHTWEEQSDIFAHLLLFSSIAIFEGWISQILSDLQITGQHKKIAYEKGLQFPSATGNHLAAQDVIDEVTSTASRVMTSCFYPYFQRQRRYRHSTITNLLHCYRYFKELRNSITHSGGTATAKTVDAYNQYLVVATPVGLGVSEPPQHHLVEEGKRPKLSLRGVVGLSDVLLRIMTTLDAELCRSAKSERIFEQRWKNEFQEQRLDLPANTSKRNKRVCGLIEKTGLPRPLNPEILASFLKTKRLVLF